jgi:glycine/D-amino acid oxidase-like deaminating enzyme
MTAPAPTADVIVIGGGIVGLSIAHQIARRSSQRVVVLEKGAGVAEGSTGASSACLRLRYTHGEVIQLSRAGLNIYQRWRQFTGLPRPRAGFAHTGILWMLREHRATVEAERDRMAALGAGVLALDAAAVQDRFPTPSTCGEPFDLTTEDHQCADHPAFLFEEEGGYCTDPAGANQDLLDAALREGVDVRLKTAVTAIRSTGGRVQGVDLAGGASIDAPTVVNAAGPWCNALNDLAGLQHNWTLRPTRIQVLLRVSAPDDFGGLPMVVDGAGGTYFRPENHGHQLLVSTIRGEDEHELVPHPDRYNQWLDADMKQQLLYALHHRLPSLPYQGRVTGAAGLYTINDEDMHPIIGPTDLEGFVVANGFSGHGFKLAPAVGGMVARWLTGEPDDLDPDVPIEFFSINRSSLALREKNVLA